LCSDRLRLHNPSAGAVVKTGLSSIRFANKRHSILEKHTSILVGVSGGIDSLVLLFLLLEYNKKYKQKWDIKACHIDAGYPSWDPSVLEKSLVAHHIEPIIVKANFYKRIQRVQDKCFFCSRERRKKLMEIAEGLDVFNIALAHHQEDAVETLLLNMLYTGRMGTLLPKQPIVRGRFSFVRPLYYLDKKTIRAIAQAFGLKILGRSCPFYQDSRRELIRNLLYKIQEKNPDIYTNIFHSIFNINKPYMPS
jgi:tRNA 2-thiocytidine biosynthesis protein TtcA